MCLHFLSGAGEGLQGSGVKCGSGVGLTRRGPSCPELLGAGHARLQTTALKKQAPAAWQGVPGLPQRAPGARGRRWLWVGCRGPSSAGGAELSQGPAGSAHVMFFLTALRPSIPIKVVILTYRPACLVWCSAAGPGAPGRGPPESAESSSAWS